MGPRVALEDSGVTFRPEEVTEMGGCFQEDLGNIWKGWTPRPRAAEGLGPWRLQEEEWHPGLRLFGALAHSMWMPMAATMPGPSDQRLRLQYAWWRVLSACLGRGVEPEPCFLPAGGSGKGAAGEASLFPGVREALEAGVFLTREGAGRPGLQG